MTICVSSAPLIEKLIFKSKMADGRTLERPVLHHHEILQFVNFFDGGCPPPLNFEIETFISQLLQRHVCIITLNFTKMRRAIASNNHEAITNTQEDIWHFWCFSSKNVKKFTERSRSIWLNFVKIRDN